MSDPFDPQRFVAAQDPLYAAVLAELRAGCKRTHWMWFVFPQHRALGRSAMAARYGLACKAEAAAYWEHAVLGPGSTNAAGSCWRSSSERHTRFSDRPTI